MTLDIEGLRTAVRLTEEADEQDRHKQQHWLVRTKCGTAGCFAGHYALYLGCTPHWLGPDSELSACVITPEGEHRKVAQYVEQKLGLTYEEADRLFDGNNTVEDIRRIAEQIITKAEYQKGAVNSGT